MKLPKNRQSGQALVMALILLALGSLLVVPLLGQTFTNLGYHQTVECKTVNSYTADSGVEYVVCKLYNRPGAYTEEDLNESFNLNGRSVNVTAHYASGGIYKVTAVASGGGCGSTSITCYTNLSAGSFAYALAGKTRIRLTGSTLVTSMPETGSGDICSNGNIELAGGGVLVDGDAHAVGTISGQEKVTGTVEEGSDPVTFPGDYSGLYRQMALEGGTHPGDLVINEDRELGPLYIDGDLEVKPNVIVTLTGTVYVTGMIKVENGRFVGEENIAAEGDIDIRGGGLGATETIPVYISANGDIRLVGPIVDAVVYAPNGNVDLTNIWLFGAVGGVEVTAGNAIIYWAAQLSGREDLPGCELHTIAYSYS